MRSDIERLLRKLTIEEFLMEDLVVTKDDITCAYIKVGTKGEDLISGRYKVQLNGKWKKLNMCYNVNLCPLLTSCKLVIMQFIPEFKKMVKEEGYQLKQMFKDDETRPSSATC